jgi:hypothetical protein
MDRRDRSLDNPKLIELCSLTVVPGFGVRAFNNHTPCRTTMEKLPRVNGFCLLGDCQFFGSLDISIIFLLLLFFYLIKFGVRSIGYHISSSSFEIKSIFGLVV